MNNDLGHLLLFEEKTSEKEKPKGDKTNFFQNNIFFLLCCFCFKTKFLHFYRSDRFTPDTPTLPDTPTIPDTPPPYFREVENF